jgi:hypothetical protein
VPVNDYAVVMERGKQHGRSIGAAIIDNNELYFTRIIYA